MTFTFKLARRLAHSRVLAPRLLAAVVLLAGCADATGIEPSSPSNPDTVRNSSTVASVTVTPGNVSGSVGQSAQFTALAKNSSGAILTGRTVTWTSGNSAVVSVSGSGYATAIGGGSTTINATVSGITGRASVTVTGTPAVTVGSVTVTPGTLSGNVGDTARVTASVKDASGAVITSVPVTWTTSNPAVVSVDSTGAVKGIAAGTADVIATAGGKSGKSTVTVAGSTPTVTVGSVTVAPGSASGNVGDAAQFTATVKDPSGATLTGQTVTWTSSNTDVVTVTASGYATAVGGGSASLIATAGGKSGSAAITVSGAAVSTAPVATVSLSPSAATVAVGSTQQLAVTLKDASGTTLTGRTVTWSSSSTGIGTISGGGLVSGIATGTTTVTATSEGKSASATITVTAVFTPPPPPPGSGTWVHEPSGLPTITDNGFDQLVTSDGWGIVWNDNGYGSIVQDNTAPMSPSNVLQMAYPIGYPGGAGPANAWHFLPNAKKLYIGFMWKASNPWQGHPSNVNKIMFVFPSSGGDIYIVMYGPPGGPYELRVLPQFAGIASDWLRPNVNNVPVTLGTWHKIEWVMDYSNGSTGTVQWWMDGTMIGNWSGVPFPTGGMSEIKINPTWGGLDDVKQENDYFRYDQIHISGF